MKLTKTQKDLLLETPETEWSHTFPGYTRAALRKLRKEHAAANPAAAIDAEQAVAARKAEIESYKQAAKEAVAACRQAEEDRDLALLFKQRARKSNPYVITRPKSRGHEAVACAILSDVHFEELVPSEQVNGTNEYSPEIAKQSVAAFWSSVLRLTQMHQQNVKIKRLVVFALGDFITNYLHRDNLLSNSLSPVDAIMEFYRCLCGGIDYVLDKSELELQLCMQTGNHGRITEKMQAFDQHGVNLEMLLAHMVAERYDANKRVTVVLPQAEHEYIQIFDRTIRYLHGFGVRYSGGIGGLLIPLNKAIDRWDLIRRADLTVMGHHHQLLKGPRVIVNGSVIGVTPWSVTKFMWQPPCQAFWLEDSKYSKQHGPMQFTPVVVR